MTQQPPTCNDDMGHKPCRFCGNSGEYEPSMSRIYCDDCGCYGPSANDPLDDAEPVAWERWDTLGSCVTVAEAFANAGFPLPREGSLKFEDDAWQIGGHVNGRRSNSWWFNEKTNSWSEGAIGSSWNVNIANLPARDCLDALPDCVREAIK